MAAPPTRRLLRDPLNERAGPVSHWLRFVRTAGLLNGLFTFAILRPTYKLHINSLRFIPYTQNTYKYYFGLIIIC